MQFARVLKIFLIGFLVVIGILIGLLIPEMALRSAGIEYKLYRMVDDNKGWIYRPGDAGWYRLEGESYVTINSEGFLDREHDKKKPDNTFRIALIGDSFVAAREVPPDQEVASFLEKNLENCEELDAKAIEVIKFGVAGYGTDQELLALRQNAWKYDPDLVVLAIFTDNDIANNTLYLNNHLYNLQKPGKPYFVFNKDGELVVDTSFLETEAYLAHRSWWNMTYDKLKAELRLLQVMSRVKQTVTQRFFEPRVRALNEGALMFEDEIYKEPVDSHWQEGWKITEALIQVMNQEVIAHGADFLAVTLSNDLQVHPDVSVRQHSMEVLGVEDLFYPDRRIKALGERSGFDVLNLATNLQTYAEKNHVCLHGHDNAVPCGGHWNAVGHRLAGTLIAQRICRNLKKINSDDQELIASSS